MSRWGSRARWLVVGAAAVTASCQPSARDPAPGPRPRPVIPADAARPDLGAKPPAPAPPARLLVAFGQRTLAALDRTNPVTDEAALAAASDLRAVGPCTRPTPDQRAAIATQLATADPRTADAELQFGCVEPAGTIVDVYAERARPDHLQGVWRVVRVGAHGGVTPIAEYVGAARSSFSEWVDEIELGSLALVDLDADGTLDVLVDRAEHEGGAQTHDATLSLWTSRTGKTTKVGEPGELSGVVTVARAPLPGAGPPLVLQIASSEPQRPHRYRCVEPTGALDLCPALVEAHRADRAAQIASWFIGGHTYPASGDLPDREQLAALLDEMGAPAAERPALLAAVPATTTAQHVAAEIARAVDRVPRVFGEPRPPPRRLDPRPPALMSLLGDTACAPASATRRAAAQAAVQQWIAAHDGHFPVDHADCAPGAVCRFKLHAKPAILASCAGDARAYYSVRWSFVAGGEMLARDGVFYLDGGAPRLVVDAAVAGDAELCGACGGPPPASLAVQFYRHGPALVATALALTDLSTTGTLHVAVNGALQTVPTTTASGYQIADAPDAEALDLVSAPTPSGDTELWHWNGSWGVVATTRPPARAAGAAPRSAVEAWVWHETAVAGALADLTAFAADRWAEDSEARRTTGDELVLIGADPAVIARVAAAAATVR